MANDIDRKERAYREMGFGAITAGRYGRALREAAELGPLGAIQKDIARMTAAITGAPAPPGYGPPFSPAMLARATGLAEDAVNMPLEDARRVRDSLRGMLRRAGIQRP